MFSQEASFLVSSLYDKHHFHANARFPPIFNQKILQLLYHQLYRFKQYTQKAHQHLHVP